MHTVAGLAESPLITFLMVTNGRSPHLSDSLQRWSQVATPGQDFFVCGPADALEPFGLPPSAIVDHPDTHGEGQFFRINHKKLCGARQVPGRFICILHDRMQPPADIVAVLHRHLSTGRYRFGAMNVNNVDGTASLRPLALDRRITAHSLDDALSRKQRLGVPAHHRHASAHVALNGAQFFLHRDLLHHLERPLRWFEMEDDVLSFDLIGEPGIWVTDATLTSCVTKELGQPQASLLAWLKRAAYAVLCARAWLAVRREGHRNTVLSVARLSRQELHARLADELYLIDPLHKLTASDVLPSSLERLMVRARLISGGQRFNSITKAAHGWRLR
jgi:hypothetical protein